MQGRILFHNMQDCGFAGLIYDSSSIKMSLNDIAVTKPIYNSFHQDENQHVMSLMNLKKDPIHT